MASISSYANLTCYPNQFRPEDQIQITMLYSSDYAGNRGTLHIENTRWDPTAPEADQPLTTAYGGQYQATWTIPGGTLMPSEIPSYLANKVTAWVEIWTTDPQTGERKTVYATAPTYLNMLVMWDTDYYFVAPGSMSEAHEYHATKSVCPVEIRYVQRVDLGMEAENALQSYRFYLYDNNYNLVFDSGEKYDWDSNIYETVVYNFRNLKDNSTYYTRSVITLNGGYKMSRPLNNGYLPIYVHYSDRPVISERLKLTGTPAGVECKLDTTVPYTSYKISRTRYGKSDYMDIGTAIGSDSKLIDKYAIPKEDYIYKAIVYNGDSVVATYYNEINYESSCVKISDIFGYYTAVGDVTKHPISRNDRGQILEAMDSTFPYNVINGAPNYDMGSVDGIFSDLDDDCKVITDSDYLAAKADILRAWLNNGHAKLLTYYTGEAWIVSVKGIQTTDPENNDIYHTVFQWTQIGDASLISEYVRLGLLTSDS